MRRMPLRNRLRRVRKPLRKLLRRMLKTKQTLMKNQKQLQALKFKLLLPDR